MNEWLNSLQPSVLLALMLLITILFFLFVIVLSAKLKKLRKTYTKMMSGLQVTNVEEALLQVQERIDKLTEISGSNQNRLQSIEEALKSMKAHVGVYRYNAFGDLGAEMSFSVAILSERQDGVVLTGIHNRDDTFMYAKPITAGQSQYRLTPEEEEAISRCSALERK
ncbi:DUF4446 family protein [Paenibacillus sp. GYB004]|uniref:DUF4446 family protein n=1 Tax=Paenibacillus sp. GYB004 TaxID=2994393 RepID=UPI002F969473